MRLDYTWKNSEGSRMNCSVFPVIAVIIADDILSFTFLNEDGKEVKDSKKLSELTDFSINAR